MIMMMMMMMTTIIITIIIIQYSVQFVEVILQLEL